jgi:hypothetical protein
MISKAIIKTLLDDTEVKYRECWETLSVLTRPDHPADKDRITAILDFQPTLARALFDLSGKYRELHQEKRDTVTKKGRVSPEWFRRRMKTLAGYQRSLRTAICLGKRIGDAFAWLFYGDERERLLEHYGRQEQLHTPPGIGGLGELKFIENFRQVNGHLVLYHGTTSFLKVGDFSLIDLRDLSLAAVGELKTTQVTEKELRIDVSTVGPSKEAVVSVAAALSGRKDVGHDVKPLRLPQSMEARLDRQVMEISTSFSRSRPVESADLERDSYVRELEAFCKELKTSSLTFRKVGDGHLLAGIRFRRRVLASKLTGRYRMVFDDDPRNFRENVAHIVRKGADDNELWMGPLYGLDDKYRLTPGMVPLFWWPLNPDVIEALIFGDLFLFSIYNPAHLAAKLRAVGFEVKVMQGRRGLQVEKRVGDVVCTIEGFDYFIHLITSQFWKEETVVEALSSISKRVEDGTVPPHTRIEMQIQQHFGPSGV